MYMQWTILNEELYKTTEIGSDVGLCKTKWQSSLVFDLVARCDLDHYEKTPCHYRTSLAFDLGYLGDLSGEYW